MADFHYLLDANALIRTSESNANARFNHLSKLVQTEQLKVPERVAKEIRRRSETKPINWLTKNPRCLVKDTPETTREIGRLSRVYSNFLTEARSGADVALVCLGLYWAGSGWTVVSDDHGVQVACFRENLHCLSFGAFIKNEGI